MKKIFANGTDEVAFLNDLKKRSGETNKKVTEVVSEIIENVKENGDEAVKNYTLKFDGNREQPPAHKRGRLRPHTTRRQG